MIQNSSNETKGAAAVWSASQFMARFPDEETARKHVERMRWGNAVGKYLHRYVEEFAMRNNHRRSGTEHHLNTCIRAMAGKELPCKKLAN
ncbi:MAG: hypothetical protein OXU83_00085 [Gammaproteobacteria bacterium]|nr:hypothetical protein [Gammaproteobacteria bacterium]